MHSERSVFDTLAARPNARIGARMDLGHGQGVAFWSNHHDRVRYENPGLHTISLYLEGGQETRRLDLGVQGRPGGLCVMPRGGASDWQIGGRFRFVHLYLDDDRLRHFMATTLDREPATLALPDLAFHDDPALAGLMGGLAAAVTGGEPLAARIAMNEIRHHLLTTPLYGARAGRPLRGGLGRAASRRVTAFLHDHLDQTIRLADLAALAGLSEFHFQRMFRVSHGLSPHRYLEALRTARAEALIAAGEPLAQVAIACGYANQSHLTRAFRKATGLTPLCFRRAALPLDPRRAR
jgi:AraC family transcriptional regulator